MLTQLIDGPSLRLRLRDGFGCEIVLADSGSTLELELPDVTLSQDITWCHSDPDLTQLQRLLAGR
jgi:hypothetical protein